jgi:uncharacterized membrane protein
MMFSVVGWLWETPWVSFRLKKYVNRGFLNGPYIPIYGCAVVTIILSMVIFKDVDTSKWYFVIIQMIYMALVTALWEFVTSWVLEKLFHTRWWDYSSHKFNIQGRVSLYVSVFFGIGGYVLWRFVLPPFEWVFDNTSDLTMIITLSGFYIAFSIDSFFTLRDLFTVRSMMIAIEKLSRELKGKLGDSYDGLKLNLNTKKDNLYNSLQEMKDELERRYNNTQNILTPRVKSEFSKISKAVSNNKYVARFYKKYPNSSSERLQKSKAILASITKRVTKK